MNQFIGTGSMKSFIKIRYSILCLIGVFNLFYEVMAQTEQKVNPLLDKGVVFFGLSGGASLRESENENSLLVTIAEQDKKGFNVSIAGGYMLKQDFAAGGALRYDQSRINKTTIDGDGIETDMKEAGSIMTVSGYIKNFIPLTSNRRINLYNITGIAWSADRNTVESTSQDILTRTYTDKNTLQLGISPGIQVFVLKGFATEVGVNVAGLSASKKEVSVNGVPDSSVDTFDVDLKIDILSLNISFYYYFPIK